MLRPTVFGEDLLDGFFDDFSGFPFYDDGKRSGKLQKQLYGRRSDKLMRTDVRETDHEYIFAIDLPGFKKENIQVSIENGYLTVAAQKTVDKESARYLRKERFSGSLQRSFYVGEDIREEDVQAAFKHGVLRLTLPKKGQEEVPEKNRYIAIEG